MKKAIIYLNQFFGQIGGEDEANFPAEIREGQVGAAAKYDKLLDAEVTHTIICGDNYMGSHTEKAVKEILDFLEGLTFDIFIAGPAFQAGRYGVACGIICRAVKKKFGVPVLTSMNVENPGVEMFKSEMVIFKGGHSAGSMRKDLPTLATYANKILNKEVLLSADEEGYFARGIRFQCFPEGMKPAADRAVEMLIKKVRGEEYVSELPIPKIDRVEIAPAVKDLSKATIALVTTGGIIPVGNPDKIQSASATRWGRYSVKGMAALANREQGAFQTIHAGYDPAAADNNPNRVVPLDALREYEKDGKIAKVYDYFFSTVGTGTTQAEGAKMGMEMAEILKKDKVTAVILTST